MADPFPWDRRAADHDETTLTHALGIGRSRVRREPTDASARRGVLLLEAVVAFLGVKPRGDEVDVRSNGTSVELRATINKRLKAGVARIAEDHARDLHPTVEVSK